MSIYVAYSATLSITAFFARVYIIDLRTTAKDTLKALLLRLFEVTMLQFGFA